jgi:hypothetical protein
VKESLEARFEVEISMTFDTGYESDINTFVAI